GELRSGAVQVFQIDACLPPHGCADPGPPIWRQPLPDPPRAVEFLTFSRGPGSRPYLYYGFESARVAGTRKERLWDVTDIGSTGRVTEITDGGGSYVDACGNTVDYWGHYYSGNASGFRNVAPRMGKWHDRYFYRVAIGLFDVHTLPP
ncbi:MAG: hypothetical protein KC620_18925, partial [Myxococcales bacterium]|nr:hypothetical protein [Myxococcales bacterium]